MLSSHRLCLTVVLVLLASSAAEAQSALSLPSEAVLNRYGLTLDWWGQAVLDPRRDRVQFLTADEQNVYVQATSGVITTFGGESGRRLWSSLLGAPDQVGYPAASNDEQLLLSVGMRVFSLNKMTGEMQWEIRAANHPSASPSVDDDQMFLGTVAGSVYGYDIRMVRNLHRENMLPQWIERARQWNFNTPNEIISPPVIAGNRLVFASKIGTVFGIDKRDRTLRFQFESDSPIRTPLGFSKEYVLAATESARMYCLSIETGRPRWTFSSGSPIRMQPQIIGRQVFVVPHREGMVAINVLSGREIWEQRRVTEFIAASGTRVYAVDISGNLLILNRETGAVIGAVPMRNFRVRVHNDRTDRIYLATEDGTVIALREQDSDFPIYHLHPERRPILPEFASDEDAPAAADEN